MISFTIILHIVNDEVKHVFNRLKIYIEISFLFY